MDSCQAPSSLAANLFPLCLQRGCGRSTPLGCLEDNNTAALVQDFEALREALGIDKWLLFGGSWGVALSLAYARAHSDRCNLTNLAWSRSYLGTGKVWL